MTALQSILAAGNEAVMSTHRQARCINQCAAHIGPDTSATIDGLPLAVKQVVSARDEARKEAIRLRVALERIRAKFTGDLHHSPGCDCPDCIARVALDNSLHQK